MDSQIDDHVGIDIALDPRVAVAHHVVPDAAITALGDQLLPPGAAKCVLALFRTELHHGVEEGEIETPDFDPRAPRRVGDGRIADGIAAAAIGVVVRRRCDGGLDGRERFGETSREEQLGGLAVRFGDLRRLLPRGRHGGHGRCEVPRPADILVRRSHALLPMLGLLRGDYSFMLWAERRRVHAFLSALTTCRTSAARMSPTWQWQPPTPSNLRLPMLARS